MEILTIFGQFARFRIKMSKIPFILPQHKVKTIQPCLALTGTGVAGQLGQLHRGAEPEGRQVLGPEGRGQLGGQGGEEGLAGLRLLPTGGYDGEMRQ